MYFEWAMYGSHITYAYNCLVRHEFEHLTFTHPATGQQVPGPQVSGRVCSDAFCGVWDAWDSDSVRCHKASR